MNNLSFIKINTELKYDESNNTIYNIMPLDSNIFNSLKQEDEIYNKFVTYATYKNENYLPKFSGKVLSIPDMTGGITRFFNKLLLINDFSSKLNWCAYFLFYLKYNKDKRYDKYYSMFLNQLIIIFPHLEKIQFNFSTDNFGNVNNSIIIENYTVNDFKKYSAMLMFSSNENLHNFLFNSHSYIIDIVNYVII